MKAGRDLAVAGLSLINFFRDYVFIWIGAFFIPFGLGVIGLGGVRFRTKAAVSRRPGSGGRSRLPPPDLYF